MERTVIEVEGLGHGGQPIPLAVRRGQLLVTGSVSGRSRSTGQPPEDVGDEIRDAFDNVVAVLDAAGMSLADVVKIDVALSDLSHRDRLNEVWCTFFPRANDRPARHTTVSSALPGGLRIQLAVLAFEG